MKNVAIKLHIKYNNNFNGDQQMQSLLKSLSVAYANIFIVVIGLHKCDINKCINFILCPTNFKCVANIATACCGIITFNLNEIHIIILIFYTLFPGIPNY